jgi:tRNA modification GTPase
MFSTSDTIVAVATPPGRGGIGVVRLSGPDACRIALCLTTHDGPFEPRRATFTRVRAIPEAAPTSSEQLGIEYVTASSAHTISGDEVTRRGGGSALERSRPGGNGAAQSVSETIDHVVATYFVSPASYTGDDVVELSAHGSPVVLRTIVAAAVAGGARLAEPGEFTLRAFLNGRIDLAQAEAVRDLIDAATPLQARAAFDQLQGTLTFRIAEIDEKLFDLIARLEASVDFPEEGYHFIEPADLARAITSIVDRATELLADARRGRLLREGLQIAIAGKPNVGKSSVFNALVGASRAIVTAVPGTTRDLVTELVDLAGLRVTLVDTAGLRDTRDVVEIEGVERARQAQRVADLILVVLDGGNPLDATDHGILEETAAHPRLVIVNKADLEPAWSDPSLVHVSAKTGSGMPRLTEALVAALDIEPRKERPEITNVRHIGLVEQVREALVRARSATLAEGGTLSEEFILADLQQARAALDEVVGRRTSDDVLTHIFSKFCLGK